MDMKQRIEKALNTIFAHGYTQLDGYGWDDEILRVDLSATYDFRFQFSLELDMSDVLEDSTLTDNDLEIELRNLVDDEVVDIFEEDSDDAIQDMLRPYIPDLDTFYKQMEIYESLMECNNAISDGLNWQ